MSKMIDVDIDCADGTDRNCHQVITVKMTEEEYEKYLNGEYEPDEVVCPPCGSDQDHNDDDD